MLDSSVEFPKIIWIMWLQGLDAAPNLVKQCLLSWQRHNRGWKIVFLDGQNFKDYINLDDIIGHARQTISLQALSDIIRINLLAKFGGVWVDSTCFCCRPLDGWIEGHVVSGFFAFEKPGKDRLISSWFLASTKNCHLTVAYSKEVNLYWSRNHFLHQHKSSGKKAIKLIGKVLNHNARLAGLWVHPLTAKLFQLYPYHWVQYIFYRLVTTDERSGKIWSQTPKISADIPHRLLRAGLLKPVRTEIKAFIDDAKDPFYKLNWRRDKDSVPGCILDYLLGSN